MIRFRSTHPALALPGRAYRFVDGVADVPVEIAVELRSLSRRRPWLRLEEVGPTPVQAPRVRRERREPFLAIVAPTSGSAS